MKRSLYSKAQVLIVGAVVAGVAVSSVGEQKRVLGTIGPPPRKNPQRQASAEGMPPLPIPVVPLRRSEPKAEPQAPLLPEPLGDRLPYCFEARAGIGEQGDIVHVPLVVRHLELSFREVVEA